MTMTRKEVNRMDYTSELYEVDYYKGWLVIKDKTTKANECVQLTNKNGRNITLSQFKSGIKSHGLNKTCATFLKLVATYKPTSIPNY